MNNNENNNIRFEDLVGDNQQNQAPNNNPPIWEVNNNGGKKGTDTYSLVSMILGIASLVLCCCVNYVPFALGIAAIVLYAMAKKKGTANGMATARSCMRYNRRYIRSYQHSNFPCYHRGNAS